MQFTRHGEQRENIIESMNPLEKVEEFILQRLDSLLEVLLLQEPEIYFKYLSLLKEKTRNSIREEGEEFQIYTISEMVQKYCTLRDDQELSILQARYYAQLLQVDEVEFNSNNVIDVSLERFTQSVVFSEYLWVSTLAEIIGKEKASTMYREAIERYVIKYDTNHMPHFESLEELRAAFLKFVDSGRLGRIRVSSNVEKGVWIFRCDNCEKVESLGDTSHLDRDILNAVQCSADFQVTRLYNDNFVMTRTQTIAKGDPYCDWVYHDLRYDKKLEHPSKEYMDGIWPLTEQKGK